MAGKDTKLLAKCKKAEKNRTQKNYVNLQNRSL